MRGSVLQFAQGVKSSIRLIAVLGHDLRNPLAAIQGGAELLLKMQLTEKATALATTMRLSAARMRELIDNVMDFARSRMGQGLPLQRRAGESVALIIAQVSEELLTVTPALQIETHLAIYEPVNCDRHRLAQLLSNLLGNALTHGAADRPVQVHATTADGSFELSVANEGNPIPSLLLDRIFEPFSRNSLGSGRQGLGLGLYIARQIATAHGGTLSVSSTPVRTCFTFRMPLS